MNVAVPTLVASTPNVSTCQDHSSVCVHKDSVETGVCFVKVSFADSKGSSVHLFRWHHLCLLKVCPSFYYCCYFCKHVCQWNARNISATYTFVILWNVLWCWRIFLSAVLWSAFMGNASKVLLLSYCWDVDTEKSCYVNQGVNYWLGDMFFFLFLVWSPCPLKGVLNPCWWLLKGFFTVYLWFSACIYFILLSAVIHIWVNDSLFQPSHTFLICIVIFTVLKKIGF